MDNDGNKSLSEEEYRKKAKKLEYYKKIQHDGIWAYSLKMGVAMAVGFSILPAFNQPLIVLYHRFFFSFIFGSILFLALWPDIDKKIKHLTVELEQKKNIKISRKANLLHLLILFVLLAAIVSPLFFKAQFSGLDKKISDYINEYNVEKISQRYSLEPIKVKLQFEDGTNAVLTAPKAYFVLGNTYKKEGTLVNELSASKIHLAAMLPDLIPWRITKENMNNLGSIDRENIYRIFIEDPGFVSINLWESSIDYDPYEKDSLSKKMLVDMASSHEKVVTEFKYGLNIRNTKSFVAGKINGTYVNFSRDVVIAEPIAEGYPHMRFICDAVCTIISDYNNKIGLAVSFHSSNLDKWKDIWEKANSKVDNMLKWE